MFFRIKKYFKGKKNKFYQNELIDKLNIEHQKLFEIVGKMDEAIAEKNAKKIKKLIGVFSRELELHVLYEDTNLYEHLYLRYHYYPDVRTEIEKKHNEIKNIAVAVGDFITKHKKLDNIDSFKDDFEAVKQVLVKRVSFEEEILYGIYATNQKTDQILLKLKRS